MIHNLKHTAQSSIRRSLITKFMGPTWGPPDADRTQIGPCSPHESCYLGSWYQYTHICRKRSLSVNNCTIPLAFYTRSALCWALFNSSPPNAAYLPPCIGLAMIQIMVCRLSLSRLNQCWLVNWKLRNKFTRIKIPNFLFMKMYLKVSSAKLADIFPRGDELIETRGGVENVPGIPGACATRNLTYLARGPCCRWRDNHSHRTLLTRSIVLTLRNEIRLNNKLI